MKNILVTIDFDKESGLLIDKAFELAMHFKSKIWILHIAEPEPDFIGYAVGPQYIRDHRAEELREEHKILQKYAEELRQKGVDAEGLLIQGPTIEMIIEESVKLNTDLIIAGHHKHGFFYNAFVGSVSTEIIKESNIPVLIIPLH